MVAGALTLIALQVLGSGKGPEQGGQLLVWLSKGLQAALSPSVAAIPTTKTGKPGKPAPPAKAGEINLPRNPPVGSRPPVST